MKILRKIEGLCLGIGLLGLLVAFFYGMCMSLINPQAAIPRWYDIFLMSSLVLSFLGFSRRFVLHFYNLMNEF